MNTNRGRELRFKENMEFITYLKETLAKVTNHINDTYPNAKESIISFKLEKLSAEIKKLERKLEVAHKPEMQKFFDAREFVPDVYVQKAINLELENELLTLSEIELTYANLKHIAHNFISKDLNAEIDDLIDVAASRRSSFSDEYQLDKKTNQHALTSIRDKFFYLMQATEAAHIQQLKKSAQPILSGYMQIQNSLDVLSNKSLSPATAFKFIPESVKLFATKWSSFSNNNYKTLHQLSAKTGFAHALREMKRLLYRNNNYQDTLSEMQAALFSRAQLEAKLHHLTVLENHLKIERAKMADFLEQGNSAYIATYTLKGGAQVKQLMGQFSKTSKSMHEKISTRVMKVRKDLERSIANHEATIAKLDTKLTKMRQQVAKQGHYDDENMRIVIRENVAQALFLLGNMIKNIESKPMYWNQQFDIDALERYRKDLSIALKFIDNHRVLDSINYTVLQEAILQPLVNRAESFRSDKLKKSIVQIYDQVGAQIKAQRIKEQPRPQPKQSSWFFGLFSPSTQLTAKVATKTSIKTPKRQIELPSVTLRKLK